MPYHDILKQLGLSEREAKIYLTSLELGPETAQKIAKKSGIARTTAYGQIKSLIRKGLMNVNKRDKKLFFATEPPENLLVLINSRKREFLRLCNESRKLIPKLRLLFETNEERPRVKLFEGREGLKSIIKDFAKSKFSSVEEFTSTDEAYEFLPPRKNDYRQKLKTRFRNIPMRIIYTSKEGAFLKPRDKLKERRFLPKDQFPFSGSITVYGNKLFLISQKKTVIGIQVESKEIANTLRIMFDLAWDAAAKYQKINKNPLSN